jgi:hypothetical protein
MDVCSALDRAFKFFQAGRRYIRMRDAFCLSIHRQANVNWRNVGTGRVVKVIQLEEMNGLKSSDKITKLIYRYRGFAAFAAVFRRTFLERNGAG